MLPIFIFSLVLFLNLGVLLSIKYYVDSLSGGKKFRAQCCVAKETGKNFIFGVTLGERGHGKSEARSEKVVPK